MRSAHRRSVSRDLLVSEHREILAATASLPDRNRHTCLMPTHRTYTLSESARSLRAKTPRLIPLTVSSPRSCISRPQSLSRLSRLTVLTADT